MAADRPDPAPGDEFRRELVRQAAGIVTILLAAPLLDPTLRRNLAHRIRGALRSVELWLTEPIPAPTVVEISALMQEARRITQEAADRDNPE